MICDGLKVTLPADLALSTEQAGQVRQLMGRCEQALRPATAAEIGAEVAGLLLAFPAAQMSEATARVRARAYHTALEGVPAWALVAAARRWLRDDTDGGNPDFAPSPPRLRRLAGEALLPVRELLVQLQRLDTAEVERVVPLEERARAVARLQGLWRGAIHAA